MKNPLVIILYGRFNLSIPAAEAIPGVVRDVMAGIIEGKMVLIPLVLTSPVSQVSMGLCPYLLGILPVLMFFT